MISGRFVKNLLGVSVLDQLQPHLHRSDCYQHRTTSTVIHPYFLPLAKGAMELFRCQDCPMRNLSRQFRENGKGEVRLMCDDCGQHSQEWTILPMCSEEARRPCFRFSL
ncbi:hypothetical protein PoB_000069800 [Plakobranchus ocellatus]|uniref:Uncharacterized protein n=1 Tax=Plakobranchus ocellatus TaxID=259542 RepID=A0AAV3XV13_9GAST|nr:hypothetical protein PoB_000069800 [Plakobranchus ocellatus]